MIIYDPLWKTMEEKNCNTYILRNTHNMSNSTVQRLRKNKPVSTITLDKLCKLLQCSLRDVAEYVDRPDDNT